MSKAGSSHIAPPTSQPALSTNANGAAADCFQSSCRPWERGDLLRRLATFKPSTWASKTKVVYFLIRFLLTCGIIIFVINHSSTVDFSGEVFVLHFCMRICLEPPSSLSNGLE